MARRGRRTAKERFDHLVEVISSDRFLKKQGPGNEVPFFICPFDAEDAVEMERQRGQLTNQLSNRGLTVLEINLYDLAVQMLYDRGIWADILEAESSISKAELKELFQGVLNPESYLIPAIAAGFAATAGRSLSEPP